MAIDVEQLIMAVAEVTNGDTPAALVDAQGTIGFVFFEVQSRMTRVRNKLSQRNIDSILNVRSQFCIGLQEALRPRDPHRHDQRACLWRSAIRSSALSKAGPPL